MSLTVGVNGKTAKKPDVTNWPPKHETDERGHKVKQDKAVTPGWDGKSSFDDAKSNLASLVAGAVNSVASFGSRAEALCRGEVSKYVAEVLSGIDSGTLSKKKAGPVLAAVVDNQTGETFRGINDPKSLPPNDLHPLLKNRLDSMAPGKLHDSRPGGHAEVYALDSALKAREARTGKPVTEADLRSFTLDTAWLKDSGNGAMSKGASAERCANCSQLTKGVNNLAGDSIKEYSSEKATKANVPVDSPPSSRWSEKNMNSLRDGTKYGAAAGFLGSTIHALSDGKFTASDAVDIAKGTVLGGGTGALGGLVEDGVARAIDKAAGSSLQRGISATASKFVSAEAAAGVGSTGRVLAGRLGGAGVAGAVIGAGFSAVDQIQAYNDGKVTASQAIGTVTGDAAVGLGAGMAGAAAGAAIGSIIPVAGTVVGGLIGFGVGVAAGYLADKGLRSLGVDKAIASGVTAAIDKGAEIVDAGKKTIEKAGEAVGDAVGGAAKSLANVFGW